MSNLGPARRFHVARDVIFCYSCKDLVPQFKCLVSELGLRKIETFRWRLREHRHEVTVDNCWKSQLAL